MAASSGRSAPVVMPGTGVSESSRRASSRPRSAHARQFLRCAWRIDVGPGGHGYARPLHPQSPGVGLPVVRIVQHGQRVVEQVFYTQAQPVQVALGGGRQVGAPSPGTTRRLEGVEGLLSPWRTHSHSLDTINRRELPTSRRP